MTAGEVAHAVAAADRARDGRALAALAHPHVARDYKRRQLDHLRGPPEEELRERTGIMRPLVRWSLRRGAGHILNRIFEVADLEAFEALSPEEVLGRAFTARYKALPPFRNVLRFLSVVEVSPDRAYAVFET
jgi:hypothetical protein